MPTATESDIALPVDLSPTELALLEFTNGSATTVSDDQRLMFLSKEAYLWAAIIAQCAQSRPLTLKRFESATRDMFREFAGTRSPSTFDVLHSEALFRLLTTSFAQSVGIESELSTIQDSARVAYANLVRRGLIEDPFVLDSHLLQAIGSVPHVAFAVLGLIPTEFGRVTTNGKTTSLRIKTLYLDYERELKGETEVSTHVRFRVLQLVKSFLNLAKVGLDSLDGDSAQHSPMRKSSRGPNTSTKGKSSKSAAPKQKK